MKRKIAFVSNVIAFCVAVGFAGPLGVFSPAPAAAETSHDSVTYIDQGWSMEERNWYYWVSQGSAVMSYDVFLAMEVADSEELFSSDENSARYGLIPEQADAQNNPDGLAIGLAKTVIDEPLWEGQETGEMIGLTCAACHNAQLNYKGQQIRIDGGVSNMFDFMAYVYAIDDAMQATLHDTAKFDRMAERIGATSSDDKDALRKRFEGQAATVHAYRTRVLVTPNNWGPARLDAIGLIVNRLIASETDIPENLSTPLAPTKPPFLWNAPQGLWTQWRGVQQDPIGRNLIETMGVFMPLNLHAASPEEGLFESNAAVTNLQEIENQLARLAPPQWPEDVLGKIDREKAAEGKGLFVALCSSCHNAWPYTWSEPNEYGKSFVMVGLIPQSFVGTDPGQFNDLRPYAITGQLSEYLPGDLKGAELVTTGELYAAVSTMILETALAKVKLSEADTLELHGYRELPVPRGPEHVYKAAPRDGVWATPPFLHNGSVPNLYEMLIPADERTKQFYVGREFDPIKVGLDTSGASGMFLLDTTLPGNSNAGHSFQDGPRGNGIIGPLLTEEQRWALVEYLKSIPEDAGRVTPFGGPQAAQ